ncbi:MULTISPECIES: hypothetical protein [Pontibacillus]|uniref:Uncharacterized protein n=1 Tax=Pontibacillus chungwhensis TaxID=265426 RepID=A0ABY8V916_9BACI|nr:MULTISPECIES: hypothetical protein [Pontibacillus]MCD5326140.1 hypothetical protein [Pontibacillus sp. HN14]WIG00302.1 hypothetical protein QNI29_21080 [Pontibacillus chungwhensis]
MTYVWKGRDKNYYGSVKEVMFYTGIRLNTLDNDMSEEELEMFVESMLRYAKDFINHDRRRNYVKEVKEGLRESVPEGIHFIAIRLVANMLGQAQIRRDKLVTDIQDFNNIVVTDRVFSKEIRRDLEIFPRKVSFHVFSTSGDKREQDVGESKLESNDLFALVEASEDLTAGVFVNVYKEGNESRVRLADETDERVVIGFINEDVYAGELVRVYNGGFNKQLDGLSVGEEYVLGTDGSVRLAGDDLNVRQSVGRAISDTVLSVEIGDVRWFS